MNTEKTALALGYAGLIPFVALALAPLIGVTPAGVSTSWLLAYAAVILSFLGGIIWGRVLHDFQVGAALIISILVSLAGWVALLIGGASGLILCAIAFAATLVYDLSGQLPPWFRRLRIHLTLGAIGSTLIGAVLS